MRKINILIAGCGGDIGQSIAKILKSTSHISRLIGTDLNNEHASIFLYDECYVLPRCTHADYLNCLKEIVLANDIDVIIPASESEIRFLYENNCRNIFSAKVLLVNAEALNAGLDKFETILFLKKNGLNYPITYLVDDNFDLPYPFMAKSRVGSGSKNVFMVKDKTYLNYLREKGQGFIFQEYLPNESEEYTCGLFRSSNGDIRHITFRRKLIGVFSSYGEVVIHAEIDKLLVSIANHLGLIGSINVQLRFNAHGPCVFEINPRFSSTVRFRDLMGFHDVIWSLEDLLGEKISSYTIVAAGKKFYKGFSEYID